jgi:hypothetical protein
MALPGAKILDFFGFPMYHPQGASGLAEMEDRSA